MVDTESSSIYQNSKFIPHSVVRQRLKQLKSKNEPGAAAEAAKKEENQSDNAAATAAKIAATEAAIKKIKYRNGNGLGSFPDNKENIILRTQMQEVLFARLQKTAASNDSKNSEANPKSQKENRQQPKRSNPARRLNYPSNQSTERNGLQRTERLRESEPKLNAEQPRGGSHSTKQATENRRDDGLKRNSEGRRDYYQQRNSFFEADEPKPREATNFKSPEKTYSTSKFNSSKYNSRPSAYSFSLPSKQFNAGSFYGQTSSSETESVSSTPSFTLLRDRQLDDTEASSSIASDHAETPNLLEGKRSFNFGPTSQKKSPASEKFDSSSDNLKSAISSRDKLLAKYKTTSLGSSDTDAFAQTESKNSSPQLSNKTSPALKNLRLIPTACILKQRSATAARKTPIQIDDKEIALHLKQSIINEGNPDKFYKSHGKMEHIDWDEAIKPKTSPSNKHNAVSAPNENLLEKLASPSLLSENTSPLQVSDEPRQKIIEDKGTSSSASRRNSESDVLPKLNDVTSQPNDVPSQLKDVPSQPKDSSILLQSDKASLPVIEKPDPAPIMPKQPCAVVVVKNKKRPTRKIQSDSESSDFDEASDSDDKIVAEVNVLHLNRPMISDTNSDKFYNNSGRMEQINWAEIDKVKQPSNEHHVGVVPNRNRRPNELLERYSQGKPDANIESKEFVNFVNSSTTYRTIFEVGGNLELNPRAIDNPISKIQRMMNHSDWNVCYLPKDLQKNFRKNLQQSTINVAHIIDYTQSTKAPNSVPVKTVQVAPKKKDARSKATTNSSQKCLVDKQQQQQQQPALPAYEYTSTSSAPQPKSKEYLDYTDDMFEFEKPRVKPKPCQSLSEKLSKAVASSTFESSNTSLQKDSGSDDGKLKYKESQIQSTATMESEEPAQKPVVKSDDDNNNEKSSKSYASSIFDSFDKSLQRSSGSDDSLISRKTPLLEKISKSKESQSQSTAIMKSEEPAQKPAFKSDDDNNNEKSSKSYASSIFDSSNESLQRNSESDDSLIPRKTPLLEKILKSKSEKPAIKSDNIDNDDRSSIVTVKKKSGNGRKSSLEEKHSVFLNSSVEDEESEDESKVVKIEDVIIRKKEADLFLIPVSTRYFKKTPSERGQEEEQNSKEEDRDEHRKIFKGIVEISSEHRPCSSDVESNIDLKTEDRSDDVERQDDAKFEREICQREDEIDQRAEELEDSTDVCLKTFETKYEEKCCDALPPSQAHCSLSSSNDGEKSSSDDENENENLYEIDYSQSSVVIEEISPDSEAEKIEDKQVLNLNEEPRHDKALLAADSPSKKSISTTDDESNDFDGFDFVNIEQLPIFLHMQSNFNEVTKESMMEHFDSSSRANSSSEFNFRTAPSSSSNLSLKDLFRSNIFENVNFDLDDVERSVEDFRHSAISEDPKITTSMSPPPAAVPPQQQQQQHPSQKRKKKLEIVKNIKRKHQEENKGSNDRKSKTILDEVKKMNLHLNCEPN